LVVKMTLSRKARLVGWAEQVGLLTPDKALDRPVGEEAKHLAGLVEGAVRRPAP
jgi:hypothetical protein